MKFKKIRITDTYSTEDVETLNCLGFIGTMAMIIVATVAKVMGVI